MTVNIDPGRIVDAPFVAWTVLTALDIDSDDMQSVIDCCVDVHSMYSWNKALIAKVNGKCVGCIISYDGAEYSRLRNYTWAKMWNSFDSNYVNNIAHETYPGEYYLDSIAVIPQYRGVNIGKMLILEAIRIGAEQGHTRFGLIVDVKKPHLYDYYKSLGFNRIGSMEFFGHTYHRMQLKLNKSQLSYVNSVQQPEQDKSSYFQEDTGEFTQEELDYWYLNQQNDDD
jgi:ribosomal protein S18 acetylase RimI-like enzyme